jgi:rhomboid protease GluP
MSSDEPLTGSPEEDAQLRAWQRVLDRFVRRYASRGPLTLSLLASFLVMHALTGLYDLLTGSVGPWLAIFGGRSTEALTALGGRDRELVAAGEAWRMVSAGFLHADATHLLFNALAMSGLGRLSEATFGRVRTLAIFLFAVLGGNLLSQMGDANLSIGASGGVFGLMGALVTFGFRRGRAMPPPLKDVYGQGLLKWVGLNLLIGFLLPFVDNRGHIGGLLTGAAMGLVLRDEVFDATKPRTETGTWLLLVVCLAMLAWALAGVVS